MKKFYSAVAVSLIFGVYSVADCLEAGAKFIASGDMVKALRAYEIGDRSDGKCEVAAFAILAKQGDSKSMERAYVDLVAGVKKGDGEALYYKGLMEYNGKGTDKNPAKAFESFMEAANKGFSPALYYVAVMYFKGDGVSRDYQAAYDYLVQARNAGFEVKDAEIAYFKDMAEKGGS